MKIGTTDIKDMFLGTIEVKKIFSGTTLLYEKLSTPSIPARYVQTTTADFNASGNYIGTEEYIILPADKPSGYKIVNLNVKGATNGRDYLTRYKSNMFNGNQFISLN